MPYKYIFLVLIWLSQSESELVAKDDNLDAADPNKDKKTEDKDEPMDEEQKEKINEQGDQVKIRFPPCELFFFHFSSRISVRYFQHPPHSTTSLLFVTCIHALLQREFDETEVDPYQGQQDKRPEPEAMDLPDDLNLDQDDEAGDSGEDAGETCC